MPCILNHASEIVTSSSCGIGASIASYGVLATVDAVASPRHAIQNFLMLITPIIVVADATLGSVAFIRSTMSVLTSFSSVVRRAISL